MAHFLEPLVPPSFKDGTFNPAQHLWINPPTADQSTHEGGGCILVIYDSPAWTSCTMHVIPFLVRRLREDSGGIS